MALVSLTDQLDLTQMLLVTFRRDELAAALDSGNDTLLIKVASKKLEDEAATSSWNGHLTLECGIAGGDFEERRVTDSRRRHQFWIPLGQILSTSGALMLRSRGFTPASAGPAPEFQVKFELIKQVEKKAELESKFLWIFSSARSGTTWLIHDIFGKIESKSRPADDTGTRPMDETGLDQVIGAFNVYPEHLYEMYHSGVDASLYFNRICDANRNRLQYFFGAGNQAFVKSWIRESYLQSLINEWGACDYDRCVVKSPNGSHAADLIMEAMPDSKMIFLVRDPRDVIKSRFSPFGSPILAESKDAALRRFAIEYFASFWNFQLSIIERAYSRTRADRRLLVKYEDLRAGKTEVFRDLLQFAGVKPTEDLIKKLIENSKLENMLDSLKGPNMPRQTGQIGRFRDRFTEEEVRSMERILEFRLRSYGYALST